MLKPRCFAVVHVLNKRHALYNAELARDAGLDGCFLISHEALSWEQILDCWKLCRTRFGAWPVGVNFLDLIGVAAVAVAVKYALPMLWVSETYLGIKPTGIELFSGFAFKHQPQPVNIRHEAQKAARHCDVLTTSGPWTGRPASPEKVLLIRQAVGFEKRIGLASGVTPENVRSYRPYVSDFLTAINTAGDDLDLENARRLVEAVRA